MLRAAVAAGTPVGKQAKAAMDAGALVTDDIVCGIIADRIKEPDCASGFILDGFPRTVEQAKKLDEVLAKNGEAVAKVVELRVPDAVLEERICAGGCTRLPVAPTTSNSTRPRACPRARRPSPSTCWTTSRRTECMRSDDTAEALVSRLKAYHAQTLVPVLQHYGAGKAVGVDANRGLDAVWADIDAATEWK